MPAKKEEIAKALSKKAPGNYRFDTDTVYTAHAGIGTNLLGSAAGAFKKLSLFLLSIPEAVIMTIFLCLFEEFAASSLLISVLALSLLFYIVDALLGFIPSKAKISLLKEKGGAGTAKLIASSFTSLQPLTYILAIATLFFVKIAYTAPSSLNTELLLVSIAVTALVYMATIRFGMAPLVMADKPSAPRSEALNMSWQSLTQNAMKFEAFNIILAIPSIIFAGAYFFSLSRIALALFFVSVIIMMPLWEALEAAIYRKVKSTRRFVYNIP